MAEGNIIYVGGQDDAYGLRLSGLKNIRVLSPENEDRIFEELAGFRGLVLLSGKTADALGEKKKMLDSPERIVHVIPEKEGDEYATIGEIVKQTIGFDLQKKNG